MANTKIDWTDKVWNPVTGCSKVSQGCKNCYAESMANRFWKARSFNDVRCHPEKLDQPLHWKKPAKIFVNSMSDLFHKDVPFEFVDEVIQKIYSCPQHTFQILTKRPERMMEYFKEFISISNWKYDFCMMARGKEGDLLCGEDEFPLKNLWLGVSIEDQKTADERIPLLLQTPAAIRFVSIEPMLGPVELLDNYLPGLYSGILEGVFPEEKHNYLDWVICGGESGPRARPLHPEWVRSLRDQCKAANIPFFFKQWGEYLPFTSNYPGIVFADKSTGETKGVRVDGKFYKNFEWDPDGEFIYVPVGKKKAGHQFDGSEYRQFPNGLISPA